MDKNGRIKVLEAQVEVLSRVNEDLVGQLNRITTALSDALVRHYVVVPHLRDPSLYPTHMYIHVTTINHHLLLLSFFADVKEPASNSSRASFLVA